IVPVTEIAKSPGWDVEGDAGAGGEGGGAGEAGGVEVLPLRGGEDGRLAEGGDFVVGCFVVGLALLGGWWGG
ncbi:MAG: hypothetical protein Q9199_005948, partial [Rusavskia elegans]